MLKLKKNIELGRAKFIFFFIIFFLNSNINYSENYNIIVNEPLILNISDEESELSKSNNYVIILKNSRNINFYQKKSNIDSDFKKCLLGQEGRRLQGQGKRKGQGRIQRRQGIFEHNDIVV